MLTKQMASTTRNAELSGSLSSGRFLDCDDILRLLATESTGLPAIPDGVKENVYFIMICE